MLSRLLRRRSDGLPPGPTSHPLRQLRRFVFDPVGFHEEGAAEFGTTFAATLPGKQRILVLGEPDAIKEVFSDTLRFAPMNEDFIYFLNQPALIFMSGETHARQRRVMRPPFLGSRMATYGATMSRIVDERTRQWPLGRPFPLLEPAKRITLDSILECVFGLSGETQTRFRETVIDWLNQCMNPVLLGLALATGGRRVRRLLNRLVGRSNAYFGGPDPRIRVPLLVLAHRERQIMDFLTARIRDAREQADESAVDVLSMLALSRYENGDLLEEPHVVNELVTLIVGGYETTATSLCWIVYHLARHPRVLERCRAEVYDVMGEGAIDPEKIRQLSYLSAAIKESMRLNPIAVGVGRRATQDCSLAGWDVPAGTWIQPCALIVHKRPDLWAEPSQFRPEHFLERRPTGSEYFPFGGGTKLCLGKAFALYEATIVLAELVRRYDLALPPGYLGTARPRGFALAPKDDLPVILSPAVRPSRQRVPDASAGAPA